MLTVRLRPGPLRFFVNGSIIAHSSSVQSLGYRFTACGSLAVAAYVLLLILPSAAHPLSAVITTRACKNCTCNRIFGQPLRVVNVLDISSHFLLVHLLEASDSDIEMRND